MEKQNAAQPRWAVHPAVRPIIELDGPGVIIFGYAKHGHYDIIETSNMRQRIIRIQSRDPDVEVVACLRCDHGEQGRERKRLSYRYRENRNAEGWLAFSPRELTEVCRDIEGA